MLTGGIDVGLQWIIIGRLYNNKSLQYWHWMTHVCRHLLTKVDIIDRTPDIPYTLQWTGSKTGRVGLPSVVFLSWSRFLAVSQQVTRVINPAVGCHYFPSGPQLPSPSLRGLLEFRCLVNIGTTGVNCLLKTVTRQRRDCDLNPGPSAPESRTLTTQLPSHPGRCSPLPYEPMHKPSGMPIGSFVLAQLTVCHPTHKHTDHAATYEDL